MTIKTPKDLYDDYLVDLTIRVIKKRPNFLKEYEKEFGLEKIKHILERIDLDALKSLPVELS
jgi:hypothetical protein